jgi:SOS response regulatory protein OraA/RecX
MFLDLGVRIEGLGGVFLTPSTETPQTQSSAFGSSYQLQLLEVEAFIRSYDTGWPWPLDAVQAWFEELLRKILQIPERVWEKAKDVLADVFAWFWGHIAYPIFSVSDEAYSIAVQWTAAVPWPFSGIARLIAFPAAFAYVGLRDVIVPGLRDAVNTMKAHFDGALNAVGETISSIFKPLVDPALAFFSAVTTFITDTMPGFVRAAVDFLTTMPQRLEDFASWAREELFKAFTALVEFFTKTVPEWAGKAVDFALEVPGRLLRWATEDLPELLKQYVEAVWRFIDERLLTPLRDKAAALWEELSERVRALIDSVVGFYSDIPGAYEREGFVGLLARIMPLFATGFTIMLALDIASIRIAGSGLDLSGLKEFMRDYVLSLFKPDIFVSVFLAVAIVKPLEYILRSQFRTTRPDPGDALKFLSKNLITVDQAREYLRLAGYREEEIDIYLRSIYREPRFSDIFTAFKRGRISEDEYRAWLSILNIDRAETLAGTLRPHIVMEEAELRLPSPFILVAAIETGELSEDTLRRILEFELIHPEFVDVVVRALQWRAARDDRALLRRFVLDAFQDGILKPDELTHYLAMLGIHSDMAETITNIALITRDKGVRRKAISMLEKAYLEGYISREDFERLLESYGIDQELVKKYSLLLSYVRDNYFVIKETRDERSSYVRTLVAMYKRGLLSEDELEAKLRQLNLNELEITLIKARAKLEYDAEQIEIQFNDLIEKLKQGRMTKSEFVDLCTKLGIKYERCSLYADYYWSKYIGDEFYKITADERKTLATLLSRRYAAGFMTKDELREELSKLGFTPEEVELRVRRAEIEDEMRMLEDLIREADSALRNFEIGFDEYVEILVSLGMRRERAEARAKRITAGVKFKVRRG